MKTAIIVSKKDPAGMNIANCLTKYDINSVNAELHIIEEPTVFSNDLDKKIEADLFIFATKHQSKEGVPSLSCHAPGNWSKAEFGGFDRKLCIAPASLLKRVFIELNNLGENLNNEITMEVTHHGPYLEKPCFFIEIGSSEKYWENKEAGKIIAQTIVNVLKTEETNNPARPPPPTPSKEVAKVAFGIGGTHYASTLNKVQLRTDIAVGHICPKYQLQNLDKEMILQAISKTKEKVDFIVLDWKGLGKEKQRIVDLLEELNLGYKRTDKLL